MFDSEKLWLHKYVPMERGRIWYELMYGDDKIGTITVGAYMREEVMLDNPSISLNHRAPEAEEVLWAVQNVLPKKYRRRKYVANFPQAVVWVEDGDRFMAVIGFGYTWERAMKEKYGG